MNVSKTGKADQSKHTLEKRNNDPLYKPVWSTKGHLYLKQEWVQVSLSTPLKNLEKHVLWSKWPAGNIYIYIYSITLNPMQVNILMLKYLPVML